VFVTQLEKKVVHSTVRLTCYRRNVQTVQPVVFAESIAQAFQRFDKSA